jgi:hypothetical protein
VLLLGDMKKDVYRKTGVNQVMLNATFMVRSRTEHGKPDPFEKNPIRSDSTNAADGYKS